MAGADGNRGGALSSLRVLECGDDAARFAGKLLAEAGADVVKIVPDAARPAMREGPAGLLDAWYDAGKRSVALDLASEAGRADFRALAGAADLVIESEPPGRLAALGLDHADLEIANPRLVQVSVTPFGRSGPRADWQSSDLVASALGGVLSVSGTPDTPLAGWGRQTANVGGFFAAISALAAVFAARRSGRGQHVDLSLHESVAACTEHVMMYWFFAAIFAAAAKPAIAERQGALHWSGIYDVLRCRDGHCMVSPTPLGGLGAFLAWLSADGWKSELPKIETDSAAALLASLARLLDVARRWAEGKSAHEVFVGGQERRLCFGEVLDIGAAARLPQLVARQFFRAMEGAAGVTVPGPIFRLTATPAPAPRAPARIDAATARERWSATRVAAPASSSTSQRPLDGIRVLDFTWVLAGPYATRILADLGADVVKLQTEERSQGVNANSFPYFVLWNRSKRSVNLNLKHPRAAELFLRMVENADVVIDNFSAGVLDRLGIGYAQASARNPRVIYLSMAGCGQTGPWRDHVTFAPTIQALCGITHLTNPPGRRDVGYGFAIGDHVSGLAGALALMEALTAREQTGKGQAIDLAQLEVGAYLVGPAFVSALSGGGEPAACGNADAFDDFVPNQVFRCRGDEWLAVTARDDREWSALCRAIGRDDLVADAALASVAGRRTARERIDAALAEFAAGADAESAMRRLQSAGVPAGLVQNARDWVERDEQLAARRWFRDVEHGLYGKLSTDAFPARFAGTPLDDYRAAPLFGEHNFEVYAEQLGMSDAEIAEAVADGLFS